LVRFNELVEVPWLPALVACAHAEGVWQAVCVDLVVTVFYHDLAILTNSETWWVMFTDFKYFHTVRIDLDQPLGTVCALQVIRVLFKEHMGTFSTLGVVAQVGT